MKVATILIPSFHGLCYERVAYKLGPIDKKKKRLHFQSLALLKQARLKRTWLLVVNHTKFLTHSLSRCFLVSANKDKESKNAAELAQCNAYGPILISLIYLNSYKMAPRLGRIKQKKCFINCCASR